MFDTLNPENWEDSFKMPRNCGQFKTILYIIEMAIYSLYMTRPLQHHFALESPPSFSIMSRWTVLGIPVKMNIHSGNK